MTTSAANLAPEVPRVDILGVGVHALNMRTAVDTLEAAVLDGTRGYVAVTGVHGIMEAQDDPAFMEILNNSLLTTPDGMPTVWIGRHRGHREMDRVYGPELMPAVCYRSVRNRHSHFLYGGQPGVAEQLADALKTQVPGIRIVGTYTPPFRPLNAVEEEELTAMLEELRPDYFWVGLSTPKQERFMARYSGRLPTTIMIGVGAAFDIVSGRVKDAPRWVKRSGMQWLHRLLQEPSRLWRRYLTNNPRFVWRLMLERRFPEAG